MSIETSIIDPELALEIVRESKVIAYDTETTGLTIRDTIVGYVVTNYDFSVYVPVRHEGGGNIPGGDEFERELDQAFAARTRYGYRTVGHNLGFDLRMSLRHGIRIMGPVEDTMLNESLINDLTVGYGLDDTAHRYGVTAKKGDELYRAIADRFGGLPDRSSMANYWRMPGDHPAVLDYATGDGVSTLEIWEKQQVLLDKEELRKPWKLECDLMPYLARMHNRGMRVDMEYGATAAQKIRDEVKTAMEAFPPGFNPRSPAMVEKLYRLNGFTDDDFQYTPPSKTKPNGSVSFTAKWLEQNEIGRTILKPRQLEKAIDSFITPLMDTHNLNGRVHPVLNQSKSDDFGVAGARLSCSDPNMQAFPKRNKVIGKLCRPLVVPDPGMIIEEADFKQQEPRLFTHYSECPKLIEGYRSGKVDMHDIAKDILGLDRDTAKRLGMGMLTMMSAKTLAMHMSWDVPHAKTAMAAFLDDAFPEIRDFQQLVVRVFKNRGYVKSILGRRARLSQVKFGYQGVSRVIQNSGGDHTKTALLRANQVEDAFPDQIQMLMTIHDSFIWQRQPGYNNKDMVAALEGVAQEPDFNLLVPIPVDVGSGLNWSEASYGK